MSLSVLAHNKLSVSGNIADGLCSQGCGGGDIVAGQRAVADPVQSLSYRFDNAGSWIGLNEGWHQDWLLRRGASPDYCVPAAGFDDIYQSFIYDIATNLDISGLSPGAHTLNLRAGYASIYFEAPGTFVKPGSAPLVDIKANGEDGPISINYNSSANLSWTSTNTDSCTASGDWSGSKDTSGSEPTGNLSSNKTYTLSCTGLTGTASDSVEVNVASSQTGTIQVKARLDGKSWSGSLNFALSGPTNLDNASVPKTYDSVSSGVWILSYISGGPGNAKLAGISPVPSLTLTSGKTLTFYFDFGTKTGCDINVNATMDGSAYSGPVSYLLNGPAPFSDNYVRDVFQDVPIGQYQLVYAYGGPGTLNSITPSNPQYCSALGTISFTMNFVSSGSNPTASPAAGSHSPQAAILCWANKDPDRCIGIVTVDKSSPVILYSHSSDPDNDIRSCQWKVYKASNLNAPVLEQNSCAPLLWDNTLGDYTASLKVIDSGGRSDSTSKNFSIKDVSALTCDFTWDPLSPSASTPVNFFDLTVTPSGTDLTKWLWTFEDATPTTSILQNPQGIMFNSSGSKSITLKVTNSKANTCSLSQTVQARTINPHWKEIIPQ